MDLYRDRKEKVVGALKTVNDSIHSQWPREVGDESEAARNVHHEVDQLLRAYEDGVLGDVASLILLARERGAAAPKDSETQAVYG